jgi:flagellin-specific chaperone FliS
MHRCSTALSRLRWQLYESNQSSAKKSENAAASVAAASTATGTNAFLFDDDYDDVQDLSSLVDQAAKLREEANALQLALQQEKEDKLQRETAKVDRWINELLIEAKVNENTELLKTVDQVLQRLTEDRYSAEQVNKIFKRLCDIRQQESRSNCSPLMSLLVDAAGKLDCLERDDNPNKRWNHKVERLLQKKLFARDWNIELEDDEDDSGNPWKLR